MLQMQALNRCAVHALQELCRWWGLCRWGVLHSQRPSFTHPPIAHASHSRPWHGGHHHPGRPGHHKAAARWRHVGL